MTWANEATLLFSPALTNHADPDRIFLPGQPAPSELLAYTKSKTAPRVWLTGQVRHTAADYLASGGGNQRWVQGVVDLGIMVEPFPVSAHKVRQEADNLETWYKAASTGSLVFRVPEAQLGEIILWDDRWIRGDWTCPFWRFEDLGDVEEAFLAGQTSNQKQVTQAAHGFALGDWIGFNGSAWVKAQAIIGGEPCDGVVSTVTASDRFTVTTGDIVKITAHGLALGPLYLSTTTPGAATSTEPSGAVRQYLGKAIDADYLLLKIGDFLPF